MKKILVIDDEWNMRNLIKIYLTREKMKIDEDSQKLSFPTAKKTYDFHMKCSYFFGLATHCCDAIQT